jgi:hypothetical protein
MGNIRGHWFLYNKGSKKKQLGTTIRCKSKPKELKFGRHILKISALLRTFGCF